MLTRARISEKVERMDYELALRSPCLETSGSNRGLHRPGSLSRRHILIGLTSLAFCSPTAATATEDSSQQSSYNPLKLHPASKPHSTMFVRLTTTFASGTIFFVIAPDSWPAASAEQIAAGLDGAGQKAEWNATHIVTTVDSYLVGPGRLRGGLAYKVSAVHQDRDGNFSEIASLVFKTPVGSVR